MYEDTPTRRRRPRDQRLNDCAWLSAQYVDAGLTMDQIAADLSCSRDAVRNGLVRCEIPSRGPGGVRPSRYPLLYDVSWLRARYVEDRWSYRRIAAELGAPYGTVQNAIARCGITPRPDGGRRSKTPQGGPKSD